MATAVSPKRHPKGKGCWYFTYSRSCVLCGRTHEFRERRWDKKPDKPHERGLYEEFACDNHFM